MRKCFPVIFVLLLWITIPGIAAILCTKHDLRSTSTATTKVDTLASFDRVCAICHTPHKATNSGTFRPLWNMGATAQTMTYSPAVTMRGTALPNTQVPTGSSQACMSCHDGTVAIGTLNNLNGVSADLDIIGNVTLTDMLDPATSPDYIDPSQMQQNHPSGISLPAAAVGFSNYNDPPTDANVAARYSNEGNVVQCATCHDPHDDANGNFLIISNASSSLCLACHNL